MITLAYKNIELIKNFNPVRDYMREFFVYGFKNRGDFDEKSGRTYDDRKGISSGICRPKIQFCRNN